MRILLDSISDSKLYNKSWKH